MTKSSNWQTVVNFIKAASVEGLERVMTDISNQRERFTDAQNAQISALVSKDDLTKASAKISAADETGGLDGYDAISAVITAASFGDVKRFVHAVDTRLKSLPEEQRNACLTPPGGDALAELLAGLGAPTDGSYMEDPSGYGDDDDMGDLVP